MVAAHCGQTVSPDRMSKTTTYEEIRPGAEIRTHPPGLVYKPKALIKLPSGGALTNLSTVKLVPVSIRLGKLPAPLKLTHNARITQLVGPSW